MSRTHVAQNFANFAQNFAQKIPLNNSCLKTLLGIIACTLLTSSVCLLVVVTAFPPCEKLACPTSHLQVSNVAPNGNTITWSTPNAKDAISQLATLRRVSDGIRSTDTVLGVVHSVRNARVPDLNAPQAYKVSTVSIYTDNNTGWVYRVQGRGDSDL